MKTRNILLIDDDKTLFGMLRDFLPESEIHGENITGTQGAVNAFKLLSDQGRRPDAVMIDIYLDERRNQDGLDLVKKFRECYGHGFGIIIITGHPTIELQTRAIELGADVFLEKPLTRDNVRAAIAEATGEATLKGSLTTLLINVDAFLGRAMEALKKAGSPNLLAEAKQLRNTLKRFY